MSEPSKRDRFSPDAGGGRAVHAALGVLVVSLGLTGPAHAQDRWSGQVSLGTNLFFGNTSAYNVTSSASVSRADSISEVSASGRFVYGEATTGGTTFVLRRSWRVRSTADFKPLDKVSPFVFGTVERSLQSRIDGRQSGGGGAKVAFIRDGPTRLDFSTALLAERTDPRVDSASPGEVETLARWSFRLRGRHDLSGERVKLLAVVFYRPKVDDAGIYTVEVDASVEVSITTRLALRVALLDRYDSQAVGRGATANNDGQVIVGLTVRF